MKFFGRVSAVKTPTRVKKPRDEVLVAAREHIRNAFIARRALFVHVLVLIDQRRNQPSTREQVEFKQPEAKVLSLCLLCLWGGLRLGKAAAGCGFFMRNFALLNLVRATESLRVWLKVNNLIYRRALSGTTARNCHRAHYNWFGTLLDV